MLRFLKTQRLLSSRTQRSQSERGVTSIEFALIAPLFVMLLVGITEMSLIFLANHLLENATYNASRTGKTGFVTEGQTQLETVTGVLLARISGLDPLLDPAKLTITTTSYGSLSDIGQPDQGTEESLGAASEVVVYTITYPWQMFTPLIGNLIGDENRVINLTSRIVVRNEPTD